MSRLPAKKKRKLSPPVEDAFDNRQDTHADSDVQPFLNSAFSKGAVEWDLEQDYERQPRRQKQGKTKDRLPIKTPDGRVRAAETEPEEAIDSEDDYGSDGQDGEAADPDAEDTTQIEAPISKVSERQQILDAKETLAKLAASVNEDPEERIGALRALADVTSSRLHTITKLGLATQVAVYKDLIPGYRIRPMGADEAKVQLSKEVKKLRNFEQSLVSGYQKYVKELTRIADLRSAVKSDQTVSLVTVAVSCACNLLKSVPHFNCRTELLRIVVAKLSRGRRDKDFELCRATVEYLFQHDDEGHASLEGTAMLCKMIKAKDFNVDEGVLNLFLSLRLLVEFSFKGSDTRIDKEDPSVSKMKKAKKQFRTKKERKIAKERKAIEKEMKEADAVVGHEQRDQMQAETLKLVFSIYFRTLKARTPKLMGPVLEGLVKYAHLINQDFFGDLLEALKDLISERETVGGDEDEDGRGDDAEGAGTYEDDAGDIFSATRESLLCVITAFALLEGQDASKAASTLQLDLSFFITHLYRTIQPLALNADLELNGKSLHLADPHASAADAVSARTHRTKVDVQTTIVILLRCLQGVLLPAHVRSVSPIRLAAFTKQILTASMHMPEKSCTAILGTVNQILKVHRGKIGALWDTEERRGDGRFDPLRPEIEGSQPLSATVWEGELLRLHYAPSVREGVLNMERLVRG